MDTSSHPSDSATQRETENLIRKIIETDFKCTLAQEKLNLGSGVNIYIDGINRENRILCEIFSRIGLMKAAQRKKVAADMLKLMLAERHLEGTWKKIIALADKDAAKSFGGSTWLAKSIEEFGFQLHVVDLPDSDRKNLLAAQAQQRMTNTNGS